jgi:hypothetical protein
MKSQRKKQSKAALEVKTDPPCGEGSKAGRPMVLVGLILGVAAVAFLITGLFGFFGRDADWNNSAHAQQPGATGRTRSEKGGRTEAAPIPQRNPLNAQRAYGYLKEICDIGRRVSGSPGMKRQQELITKHFEAHGAKVVRQEFMATDPRSRQPVPMANLIISWHPESTERVLLSAHYDTRPFPDQDPNPRKAREGTFIGANDGASGVAVMMELAHYMSTVKGRYGVDFVLFDGEELVYREGDEYFLGSKHFARDYQANPPAHKYRWGVLMDMVGGKNLQLYVERHSWSWPETRPLIGEIWGLAERMGVREFIAFPKHQVLDDHIALRDIGKIPTCDLIDFDYPFWHTEGDVPENCSGESLAKVGWVVFEWMRQAR